MNEQLLKKTGKYLIGVSGGCDSMYLLDTLYKSEYNIGVAHVNYNYRHDSYEDYQLVKNYCESRNIPFYYKECYPHECTGNFQDYAREQRYEFYRYVYETYDCTGLVLGHHLDDHLETIYMQMSHHDTVYYLGLKEVNTVYNMNVIRPMLAISKNYIRAYCDTHHIPYRDDYTNFETDFERDYVRNKILNEYSIEDKHELLKTALLHNQRIEQLSQKIKPFYLEYKEKESIHYSSIPDDYLDLFLYLILKDNINPRLISSSLIEEIKKQLQSSKPNIQMNLPVNYLFIKEYDNIYIISKQYYEDYEFRFDYNSEFECLYFNLCHNGHVNEGLELSQDDYPIMIRNFRNGDSIKTVSGTKKVSRLFIDNKIPLSQRKRWPIVLNNKQEIILVPHLAKNIDYLSTNCNLFVVK